MKYVGILLLAPIILAVTLVRILWDAVVLGWKCGAYMTELIWS